MIYVLGSLNTDLVFDVPYMPRGGETLAANSFGVFYGGKGANQAAALAKLSSAVKMIGAVGRDGFGEAMIKNLTAYGADCSNVVKRGEDSGLAGILVENGENRIILSAGANGRLTNADADAGLAGAKAGDILLTQLEVPAAVVAHALKTAKARGLITVLNPAPAKPLDAGIYRYVDIITPNESETLILTGTDPADAESIEAAINKFYSFGVRAAVITLGSRGSAVGAGTFSTDGGGAGSDAVDGQGAEVFSTDGKCAGSGVTLIPARRVKAVDTTAAGDTYVGALCNRLERGFNIVDACRFATIASSLTVQKRGAAESIPNINEVESIYKGQP
ncbi:MAG: ribokinase [Clostridiales bacterium]|jgi:ribokinase|nr:ribokinase [Clostridiales bacterium]